MKIANAKAKNDFRPELKYSDKDTYKSPDIEPSYSLLELEAAKFIFG